LRLSVERDCRRAGNGKRERGGERERERKGKDKGRGIEERGKQLVRSIHS
jgi:hypothetical protein